MAWAELKQEELKANWKLAMNGEKRIFDMKPYLDKGIYRELKDEVKFKTVRVSFDSIEWCNRADIDPEFYIKKCSLFTEQVKTNRVITVPGTHFLYKDTGI